eukprot:gene24625-65559_t
MATHSRGAGCPLGATTPICTSASTLAPAPPADADASPGVAAAEWVQGEDPSSGRTFYYNTRTSQSVWDRPAGFVEPATAQPAPLPPPQRSTRRQQYPNSPP